MNMASTLDRAGQEFKGEPGYLSDDEIKKLACESRMPKFMYDTERAMTALRIFAQNVRRKDLYGG